MKATKQNEVSAELARRIKRLTDAIARHHERLDMISFESCRPGTTRSDLPAEDLFEVAKDLAPEIERDQAKAETIFNALPQGVNAGDLSDLLTGIPYDAFRVGCFTGMLMAAEPEKLDRLTKALHKLILCEGFDPTPALKTAPRMAS